MIDLLIKSYCSHQLVTFLINLATDCELGDTLRAIKQLENKMRDYINNKKTYIPPYERRSTKMEHRHMMQKLSPYI